MALTNNTPTSFYGKVVCIAKVREMLPSGVFMIQLTLNNLSQPITFNVKLDQTVVKGRFNPIHTSSAPNM